MNNYASAIEENDHVADYSKISQNSDEKMYV